MASRYLQGRYTPTNPDKYRGKVNDIVFRSSWELVAFKFVDMEPNIIAWSSEEVIIPYRGVDGKMHRYFMDLWLATRQADGTIQKFLVEIKPASKKLPPRKTPGKRDDVFLREVIEYQTNQLKWEAAEIYCKKNGWKFIIWTEAQLVPSMQKFQPVKQRKRPVVGRKPLSRT